MPVLAKADLVTSPSGGAGLAAMLSAKASGLDIGLNNNSTVLAILSEGPE